MARPYTIRSGCSFRLADGSLATGGDTIELEDDVAQAHAEKLEPVKAEAPAVATETQAFPPIEA